MKKTLALIAISVLLLSGCKFLDMFSDFASRLRRKLPEKEIALKTSKGEIKLTVEIADSEKEREKGLMNREKLEEGKGIWFVFEDEAPRNFWMKNTLIPLDAVFFDKDKKIVSVVENMEPCKIAECPLYFSEKPAMYALEVRGGFVSGYGVKIGDKVEEK